MEFDSNKPIFLQIYDSICERILSGESPEGSRILSVRDLSKSQHGNAQLRKAYQ